MEDRYSFSRVTKTGALRKAARQRAIFEHFLPDLHDAAVVAEIGPGRGEFARECRARGLTYVGIEPSLTLARELQESGFDIVTEAVPPIPLEDRSVDLLYSYDFVEHLIDYREVLSFLTECYRVLRPQGYICVIAPNFETIKQLFYTHEYQHTFIVTKYRIWQMLDDTGFHLHDTRCYLFSLSRKLNWLDRLVAHTLVPVAVSSFAQSLMRLVSSDQSLFRINKHLFDHIAVIGRKP